MSLDTGKGKRRVTAGNASRTLGNCPTSFGPLDHKLSRKLVFAGMPPRAMRAGAVWYRYTIGYRSVSLPSTVGADVGIGPYGYKPTNTNFRDSLWSRGPKDVTGLTESVTHWLRALPAKFLFIILLIGSTGNFQNHLQRKYHNFAFPFVMPEIWGCNCISDPV